MAPRLLQTQQQLRQSWRKETDSPAEKAEGSLTITILWWLDDNAQLISLKTETRHKESIASSRTSDLDQTYHTKHVPDLKANWAGMGSRGSSISGQSETSEKMGKKTGNKGILGQGSWKMGPS